MMRSRIKFMFTMALLLSGLFTSVITKVEANGSELLVEKVETVSERYTFDGVKIVQSTQITISLTNDGKTTQIVDLVDRAQNALQSSLKYVSGTPEPDSLKTLGKTLLLSWSEVEVLPSTSVEYKYIFDSEIAFPIEIKCTIRVNGEEAEISQIQDLDIIEIELGDEITWEVQVKNTLEAFEGTPDTVPPVLVAISTMLDSEYYTDITDTPEFNQTTSISDTEINTWIVMLTDNEPSSFSVTGKIDKIAAWNEVPNLQIFLQIPASKTDLIEELETGYELLNDTTVMMGNMTEAFFEFSNVTWHLGNATMFMGDAILDVANGTETVGEVLDLIADGLRQMEFTLIQQVTLMNNQLGMVQQGKADLDEGIAQINGFMLDPATQAFLAGNPAQAATLSGAVVELMTSSGTLDAFINGNPGLGLPSFDSTILMSQLMLVGLDNVTNGLIELSEGMYNMTDGLEEFGDGLYNLTDGLWELSNATLEAHDELNETLSEYQEDKEKLGELISAAKFTNRPLSGELMVVPSEASQEYIGDLTILNEEDTLIIDELNVEAFKDSMKQGKLMSAVITVTGDVERMLFKYNDNGTWLEASPESLGIVTLDESSIMLYPMIGLQNSSHFLRDWKGREVDIYIEGANLDASVIIDYAPSYLEIDVAEVDSVGKITFESIRMMTETDLTFDLNPIPVETQKVPSYLPQISLGFLVSIALSWLFVTKSSGDSQLGRQRSMYKIQNEDFNFLVKKIDDLFNKLHKLEQES